MELKKSWRGILAVALAFGTGHAIRGQFGHEQGAAWAGIMGALVLVLVARRADWYKKALLIALGMAVGWGAGGVISYGQIAGSYSQSDNFINVFYGLSMLFIIGGLYGWLGGGLAGLTLDSTKQKPVKWGALIAEMTVGGLITYFLLVEQLGFHMTPPRGDAWAVCLGAGLAMQWYMARNDHNSPARVAITTLFGGGFGFAFGTFFHVVMNYVQIPFNTWNMAEYSVGFFGGIGLAYGIFTSKWPEESAAPLKWEQVSAFLFTLVLIPVIIFRESFSYGMFMEKYQEMANTQFIATANTLSAAILILILIITGWIILKRANLLPERKQVLQFFLIASIVYALLSYIATGFWFGTFPKNSNHHLYLVNIAAVIWLARKNIPVFSPNPTEKLPFRNWIILLIIIMILIAGMAWLSPELYGEKPPRFDRFPIDN